MESHAVGNQRRNNMILYIAGASVELARAERLASQAYSLGWDVSGTSEWVHDVRIWGPDGSDIPAKISEDRAARDMLNVRCAEVFWLLAPPRGVTTRGAWVELGVALSAHGEVIVSGEYAQSIFCSLADRHFASDAGALKWLEWRIQRGQ